MHTATITIRKQRKGKGARMLLESDLSNCERGRETTSADGKRCGLGGDRGGERLRRSGYKRS